MLRKFVLSVLVLVIKLTGFLVMYLQVNYFIFRVLDMKGKKKVI